MNCGRVLFFLAAGLGLILPGSSQAWSLPAAGECDSLDSIPIRQNVDYSTEIQPIWSNRCANCHVDWGKFPEADLSLNPKESWFFLVNQGSSAAGSTLIRVIPDKPLASLLFNKLNCEIQDQGLRMPRARPPLPLEEQALIHDWILSGAPDAVTVPPDTIFRARFEVRG